MAVLCANEQGDFQTLNEYLFEHAQEIQSVSGLKAIAASIGLNQDDFNDCYDSGKYQEKVEQWFNQANQDEVGGTPTFFINGVEVGGNQPYAIFEQIIEGLLNQ
jgi:predicted DsbA family dithiol-disulfide isomerase